MKPSRIRTRVAAGATALLLLLGGCATTTTTTEPSAETSTSAATAAVFDSSTVHTISVQVDEATLTEMIQTYLDTGAKDWFKATVTIDGQTFEEVGIKLKGNSSLRGITLDTPAQELPLRIRLDKYVEGQSIDGYSDFTVRSNNSETALNEAVSLSLLSEAGLASEQAISVRFSVNGGDEQLRLVVQNLDDTWVTQNFPDAGADSVLYKSEAEGDWSWRGEDGDYTASFDIEAGADDYAPLIKLLDLLNNGTDAEIAEQLPAMVDLDSFASYLAFQELVDNFDDIDGPGNNSYLFWDSATQKFTVVAWDHNLTFGVQNGRGGGMSGGGRGEPGGTMPTGAPPSGFEPPADGEQPEGGPGGGQFPGEGGGRPGMSRSNPLVEAFKANSEWSATYDAALVDLKAKLFTSGLLAETVDAWQAALTAGASDLVNAETIASEADAIRAYATK